DALPSTDVIVTSSETSVEVFYLLRDASSPRSLEWNAVLPPGFTARLTTQGELEIGEGTVVRLRVRSPRARDAEGRAVPVVLRWHGGVLTFALASDELTFPVLVDPVVEVVDWVLRDPGLVPGRFGHAL